MRFGLGTTRHSTPSHWTSEPVRQLVERLYSLAQSQSTLIDALHRTSRDLTYVCHDLVRLRPNQQTKKRRYDGYGQLAALPRALRILGACSQSLVRRKAIGKAITSTTNVITMLASLASFGARSLICLLPDGCQLQLEPLARA